MNCFACHRLRTRVLVSPSLHKNLNFLNLFNYRPSLHQSCYQYEVISHCGFNWHKLIISNVAYTSLYLQATFIYSVKIWLLFNVNSFNCERIIKCIYLFILLHYGIIYFLSSILIFPFIFCCYDLHRVCKYNKDIFMIDYLFLYFSIICYLHLL